MPVEDVVLESKECDEISVNFVVINNNGPITKYHVQYGQNALSRTTEPVIIDGLKSETEYMVQVQVENEYSRSNLSKEFPVKTGRCGKA